MEGLTSYGMERQADYCRWITARLAEELAEVSTIHTQYAGVNTTRS